MLLHKATYTRWSPRGSLPSIICLLALQRKQVFSSTWCVWKKCSQQASEEECLFVCLFFFLSFFFLSEPWFGRTTKETFGAVWWLALPAFSHFKENHSLSLRTGMGDKQPAPWLSAGKAVWDRAGDGCPLAGQLRLRQVGRQASRADASAGPSPQIAGDQHFPH